LPIKEFPATLPGGTKKLPRNVTAIAQAQPSGRSLNKPESNVASKAIPKGNFVHFYTSVSDYF
jgi:hypothetical protein